MGARGPVPRRSLSIAGCLTAPPGLAGTACAATGHWRAGLVLGISPLVLVLVLVGLILGPTVWSKHAWRRRDARAVVERLLAALATSADPGPPLPNWPPPGNPSDNGRRAPSP